jgi:hypothetical protein
VASEANGDQIAQPDFIAAVVADRELILSAIGVHGAPTSQLLVEHHGAELAFESLTRRGPIRIIEVSIQRLMPGVGGLMRRFDTYSQDRTRQLLPSPREYADDGDDENAGDDLREDRLQLGT